MRLIYPLIGLSVIVHGAYIPWFFSDVESLLTIEEISRTLEKNIINQELIKQRTYWPFKTTKTPSDTTTTTPSPPTTTGVEVTRPPTDVCQGDCGLLISGGGGAPGAVSSTEIYNPATNTTCPGPALPDRREDHTADVTDAGVILCGGYFTFTSCLRLAAGNSEWEQFATISARQAHTSWVTSTGKLMLLGGYDGDYSDLTTTEVVGEGPSFTLQRAASGQCLISLGDKAVLVGGGDDSENSLAEVTVYTEAGFEQELPRLNTARYYAACGVVGGMLVVAGGYDGSDSLDTVELLPSLTAPAWQAAPRLPYKVAGARMTALNGRLLLTGGWDGPSNNFAEILEFDPDTTEWRQVGRMENERYVHTAVAVTQPDSYCG